MHALLLLLAAVPALVQARSNVKVATRVGARLETNLTPQGRNVQDLEVKERLACLSYWKDGLVILDVGNGVKGGSPTKPQFVSQTKYDVDALYKDVEAEGGPGYIRGTHTAWRHGNYVFIGDEVFSAVHYHVSTLQSRLAVERPFVHGG